MYIYTYFLSYLTIRAQNQNKNMFLQLFKGVRAFSMKIAVILAAILDFSESAMIHANHPRFSCTPDMSLMIYGTNFSGPLMFTETTSGTGVNVHFPQSATVITVSMKQRIVIVLDKLFKRAPRAGVLAPLTMF